MSETIRILFIGGDAPRHLHYFSRIAAHPRVEVVGALIQGRENAPRVPAGLELCDEDLWYLHFDLRERKEREYFGAPVLNDEVPIYPFKHPSDPLLPPLAKAAYRADLTLVFGCGMIREPLFSALPGPVINLHLGLSPRYRGAATLFWPFYFLEPNHAGTTFHQITAEPDAGPILHQSRPPLKRGDRLHDVSCRAVIQATEDMRALLDRWPDWTYKRQRNTGKCFLERDFQPAHLRAVYDTWHDGIVDAYLDGVITPGEPVMYQDNLREVDNG